MTILLIAIRNYVILRSRRQAASRRTLDADASIASPDGAILWPSELARLFADPRDFDKAAYGDFETCPFTRRRPGIMQLACIAGLRHLDVRARGD
jgi:hypothetical protein